MPEVRLSGGDKGRGQAHPECFLTAGEGAEAEAEELGDGAAFLLSVPWGYYLQLRVVAQPRSNPRGMWVCLRFCSHILEKRICQPPTPGFGFFAFLPVL